MSKTAAANNFEVYAEMVRHEMVPFIPKSAKSVLDVGCSTGNFGHLLKIQNSAEVWGVEPDEHAASIAAEKLDRVVNGMFSCDIELDGKKFDCIVFNDVLEHMVDPYSALDHAKNFLSDDGRIVASIPNVRYFGNMWMLVVHRSWEYQDSGILDRTHLRFFTRKSIESMFGNAGYTIEALQGINPLEVCDGYFMKKFRVLNFFTLNGIEDMRWLQFAVVAKPVSLGLSEGSVDARAAIR